MQRIITGALVIRAGVVNRGSGIGTIQTIKKVYHLTGQRAYFSQLSYKGSLWDAQEKRGWTPPVVYIADNNSVYQRNGTIIDSEEFDFAGTMVSKIPIKTGEKKDKADTAKEKSRKSKQKEEPQQAKLTALFSPQTQTGEQATATVADSTSASTSNSNGNGNEKKKTFSYTRQGVFAVNKGISIINYMGDFEFITNGRLVKLLGTGQNSIINREEVYTLYLVPVAIELSRLGVQRIELPTEYAGIIKNDDSMEQKAKKLYEMLDIAEEYEKRNVAGKLNRVKTIYVEDNNRFVVIELTREEKMRRLKELLEGIGDLPRFIEGKIEILSPVFSAFSLDYLSPKFSFIIEQDIIEQCESSTEYSPQTFRVNFDRTRKAVEEFAEKEGKKIYCSTLVDYADMVKAILSEAEKEIR